MDNYSLTLKQYINGVGLYCSVNIEVQKLNEVRLIAEFDELFVEKEWTPAVLFAINYFFEHYLKEGKNGLSIVVRKLQTMIIDTSNIVVFYVVVKCLCEALNLKEELVNLNQENGVFTISK